jgi:hypothetical protein
MDDPRRNPSAPAAIILAAIAISLVMYVLSVGPAMWLNNRGRLPSSILDSALLIYAPLDWLAHHSEVANRILFWYAGFWE